MGKSPSAKATKVEKSMSSKEATDISQQSENKSKSCKEGASSDHQHGKIVFSLDDEESVQADEDDLQIFNATEDEVIHDEPDDRVYDSKVHRTFIVKTMSSVEIKKIVQTERSEAVLNIHIVDPTGVVRTIIVWGEQAYLVEKWFRANESKTSIPTVYLLPDTSELTTEGPLYIHTDSSKFLQFVLKPATTYQRTFNDVTEIFMLTTLLPNPRRAQLPLCHLVLPQVIEWPSYNYFTYHGEYLKQPKAWYTPPPEAFTDAEYDFSARSPVKPFVPKRTP